MLRPRRPKPLVFLPTPPPDRPQRKIPWGILKLVGGLLILGALGWLLLLSPYFAITNLSVFGTTNPEIGKRAEAIRGKNLFTFGKGKLERELLSFAEVSEVKIYRIPLRTVRIRIKERAEGIVWETKGKRWLISEDGIVVREVSESKLPLVRDGIERDLTPGQSLIRPHFISFVRELAFRFEQRTGLRLGEFSLPAETTFELVLTAGVPEREAPIRLIFDTERNLLDQLENFELVWKEKKDDIREYVDLRVEDRVYYK